MLLKFNHPKKGNFPVMKPLFDLVVKQANLNCFARAGKAYII